MPDKKPYHYTANSPQMRAILEELASIAKSNMRIMLLGESGVGKSYIAQWIHE